MRSGERSSRLELNVDGSVPGSLVLCVVDACGNREMRENRGVSWTS